MLNAADDDVYSISLQMRDIIVTIICTVMLALKGTTSIWLSGTAVAMFSFLLVIGLLNVIFTIVLLIGIHEVGCGLILHIITGLVQWP